MPNRLLLSLLITQRDDPPMRALHDELAEVELQTTELHKLARLSQRKVLNLRKFGCYYHYLSPSATARPSEHSTISSPRWSSRPKSSRRTSPTSRRGKRSFYARLPNNSLLYKLGRKAVAYNDHIRSVRTWIRTDLFKFLALFLTNYRFVRV